MRKRPRPDQIAAVLRDFQTDLHAGLNINQACPKAGLRQIASGSTEARYLTSLAELENASVSSDRSVQHACRFRASAGSSLADTSE